MTVEPRDAVVRWQEEVSARRSPDALVGFLGREFPDAARSAAERGLPLKVNRVTPSEEAPRVLRRSAVFDLEFGWDRHREFAAWRCVAALGPGGLRRLSSRPAALGEVLALEALVARPEDAEALAHLLAAAVLPERPPSTSVMSSQQWAARRHSSLLTASRLGELTGDEDGGLTALDRGAWSELRAAITPPSIELAAGGVVVTFWYLEACDPDDGFGTPFRLLRFRCSVGGVRGWLALLRGVLDPGRAGGPAIGVQRDDVAELRFWMPMPFPYSLGRPLVVGGVQRLAALVRRGT